MKLTKPTKIVERLIVTALIACVVVFSSCYDPGMSEGEVFDYLRGNITEVIASTSVTSTSKAGTGVIMQHNSGKAFVVTNYHVLDGHSTYTVKTHLAQAQKATLVGFSEYHDIAVLKIDYSGNAFQLATQAERRAAIKKDEIVYAIGNEGGKGIISYAGECTQPSGIVKAQKIGAEDKYKYVPVSEVTAYITGGMSGGVVANRFGKVVGIGTYRNEDFPESNYSVPIELALSVYDAVINGDFVSGKEVRLGSSTVGGRLYDTYFTPDGDFVAINFLADYDGSGDLSKVGIRGFLVKNGVNTYGIELTEIGMELPFSGKKIITKIGSHPIPSTATDLIQLFYSISVDESSATPTTLTFSDGTTSVISSWKMTDK